MRRFALLAVPLLAACGAPPPLPPPGASGSVALHIWEPGAPAPTVVVAERVVQEGLRLDRLRLERVRARLVMPAMDCAVSAPSGVWARQGRELVLAGPVRLAGTWQGHPVLGSASSARLSTERDGLALVRLELWHQGQRLTAPIAELSRDRMLVAPEGLDSAPLPAECAAILAALPDPLVLPR